MNIWCLRQLNKHLNSQSERLLVHFTSVAVSELFVCHHRKEPPLCLHRNLGKGLQEIAGLISEDLFSSRKQPISKPMIFC